MIAESIQISAMQEKLDSIFRRKMNRNNEHLKRIEEDGSLINDWLPSTHQLNFHNSGANLTLELPNKPDQFLISNHALGQLGSKLNAPPAKYLRELGQTTWGRNLAANILNEHAHNIAQKQVLVREVSGKVRGVLSDRFRRYDTGLLYSTFINGVQSLGARFFEANWSETKVDLRALFTKVYPIETPNNGTVHMAFGIRLQDSAFGASALSVSIFTYELVCANGMISDRLLDQVHLGRSVGESNVFSTETYTKYNDANVSAIRDMLQYSLTPEAIQRQVEEIKGLSAERIDLQQEVKLLPKMGMTKDEVQRVEKKLMNNDPDTGVQGAPTKWKLISAINNVGQDEDIDNERRIELEELAGKFAGLNK